MPTPDTIQADFDRIARLVAEGPDHADRHESFVLSKIPAASARILEVGCGTGRLARAMARRGASVTAIDVSPEMIRVACSRSPDVGRLNFVRGDFSVHAEDPGTYDCVVSVATLHHLPAAATVERMKDLLKPAGVLVIHDVRSPSGIVDWLRAALVASVNGDAAWWVRRRLLEGRALRETWREHGRGERYLTMPEVRSLCETTLPGAECHWHALWRYTVVWTKDTLDNE